jgi:hypothetical protein
VFACTAVPTTERDSCVHLARVCRANPKQPCAEPPICQFEKECPFGQYNCYGPKGINCAPDGYTPEMLSELIGHFTGFFNQFALVMLFVVYLMTEIVPGEPLLGTIGPAAMEIELMISHYISLKTMLSFMTGVAVSVILLLIQIKLAVLFGIMSFVLNYIPNVGSMIAMFLPTPVVLLDPALESWQQVMAFVGPGAVQMCEPTGFPPCNAYACCPTVAPALTTSGGCDADYMLVLLVRNRYVGNVLEPTVFGSSLNLTPLSILGALVMWGSIWKIPGAVLSVPLLGIQKVRARAQMCVCVFELLTRKKCYRSCASTPITLSQSTSSSPSARTQPWTRPRSATRPPSASRMARPKTHRRRTTWRSRRSEACTRVCRPQLTVCFVTTSRKYNNPVQFTLPSGPQP